MNETQYDISKELVEVVLEETISHIDGVYNNELYFVPTASFDVIRKINIFELMFHFKSWANTNGYMIWSSACTILVENKSDLHKRTFTGTDEVDGIIKSCEFIFDEIRGVTDDNK